MESIDREEARALLRPERRQELRDRAHEVTERCVEKRFDFCSIINARSGRCSENCKWCAQSAHWKTGCETYGWVGTDACVKAAREAAANGGEVHLRGDVRRHRGSPSHHARRQLRRRP